MKNAELLETELTGSKEKATKSEEDVISNSIPLELSLKELNFITERMHRTALIVFALTLFNIFFPVSVFSGAIYFLSEMAFDNYIISSRVQNTSVVVCIAIVFVTLILIYVYESLRRKGDVLFEEISDELEWNVRSHKVDKVVASDRPEINARIVLRSFARTTDLPFVPGKFGPAFYLVFNVLIPLLIGSRFFFRF